MTFPPQPEARERAASLCLCATLAATYARLLFPIDALLWTGFAALLGFGALSWPRIATQAKVFAVIAAVLTGLAHVFTAEGGKVVTVSIAQSLQFTALIAAMSTLRLPMRRSALIGSAAAYLVGCKARSRYAALAFGSHLLALIFSFGVVPMIGEMLRRAGLDARSDRGARQMLLAVVRGLAMVTAWSPMSISFAVVSTALPGMHPLSFMGAGLAGAVLLLAGNCALHRPHALAQAEPAVGTGLGAGSLWSLFIILGMACALFGATLLLYQLSGLPFIMASALTLPCFSLLWMLAERGAPADREAAPPRPLAAFLAVLTELRGEIFIFSASAFIGQAIVAIVLAHSASMGGGVDSWLAPLPFALLCLWLVPAVAMLSVTPTIVALLLSQAVLHSGMAAATPVTFACALSLGWSMAIGSSPVSATLLMAGATTGAAPQEIAFRWNLRYTLAIAAAGGVFITTLYLLRW